VVTEEPLLYESKDLTTHAVCVGMTGSGKTGLGVTLIEEALIDGIPVIAIDPKGDLGNLLLTFPDLLASDFRPWVDEAEALRRGHTPDEHASWLAERWRGGLAEWGQDGERIRRLEAAAERVLYTPGSRAGVPVCLLRSFAAPPAAVLADVDALRERIVGSVAGLLALLGIEADPIRSREHILLSTLIEHWWREGKSLDLPGLIHAVQKPPFASVGVLDLESFFPAADRFGLAMTLNNLLASPGFAAWTEGQPLRVADLLHGADGRPRLSVLSIAHLSDAERMFFVTVLLNEIVTWMRTQPGTSVLRAVLYMDEVFGYLPPTANPPSKTPLLTLLKQARAFGLGVVLATQNPVDLDYKALSNAGTWFLGRLQTERDKERVLAGLEGATASPRAGFDHERLERMLGALSSRVFLMNNAHDDEPVLFQTRWTLSYLGGPLTREQIARVCAPHGGAPATAPVLATPTVTAEAASLSARPALPPELQECFLSPPPGQGGMTSLVYRPCMLAQATLHYADRRRGLDTWDRLALLTPILDNEATNPWEAAIRLPTEDLIVRDEPEPGIAFVPFPETLAASGRLRRWQRMLERHLYQSVPLRLWRCNEMKEVSRVGESEGEFRARLRDLTHEQRALELERLRQKYEPKLVKVKEDIRNAEANLEREQSQYSERKVHTAIAVGATILGALFGRRRAGAIGTVTRASTAARSASGLGRERDDVERAREDLRASTARLHALEAEFAAAVEELRSPVGGDDLECEELLIAPRKSDISVETLRLAWNPLAAQKGS